MSNDSFIGAWIVLVKTKRLGGGEPLTVGYIAGCDTALSARAEVKEQQRISDDEDILSVSPVTEKTALALGVKPGMVWML